MSLAGFKSSNHPQQIAKRGPKDDVDDRGTDPEFIARLEERFGLFTLDVAAAAHNAKAPRFYTREDDGLAQSWMGRVWCNPPYSDCGAWVRKAWDEWDAVNTPPTQHLQPPELIVMLLPANRVEQKWWQEHVEPFRDRPGSPLRVEFLPGRMRFIRRDWTPGPKGDRPPFGRCLLIWGGDGAERHDPRLAATECPSRCGRNDPCPDPWHDRRVIPPDPICPERGIPQSDCPGYCLHTRVTPPATTSGGAA